MNTREQLLALNDELRRLKAEGRRTVSISQESLDDLRAVLADEPVEVGRAEFSGGGAGAFREAIAAGAVVLDAEPAAARSAPLAEARPAPARPATVAKPALPPRADVVLPDGDKAAKWQALREIVLNDPVCLARVHPGKRIVFGVGALEAAIMFVGEAPGADEEDQGEPFVGRAGQLLNRMIKAMGVERSQVYIGNILNWRPEMGPRDADGAQTGNRPPTAEEMNYCLPFIRAQIAIIQPKVIVALGKTAVDGLLGADRFKSMGAARGTWHAYADTPLRATYHPSYLLRQEGLVSAAAKKIKRDAWEDLLAVMERAGLPISEKQRNYFL
ncbi:Uracil DNA glycosylase superfamily protein [Lacunisphaera limnophila]|uniref:Type-4 uracil-DNA glycosylase n=1 Tax=Lacunisphaera limnophila TaxID=1838286 RepID=A0A1D8AZH7_9BACT|nr:uracil-DNA glycosylase [Lacunisphaera limnophila]AOS46298.1 Uracil DNA glycosylase superfamily protein [Lacunisphaera limnophila]